jgi:hypothetical protein
MNLGGRTVEKTWHDGMTEGGGGRTGSISMVGGVLEEKGERRGTVAPSN